MVDTSLELPVTDDERERLPVELLEEAARNYQNSGTIYDERAFLLTCLLALPDQVARQLTVEKRETTSDPEPFRAFATTTYERFAGEGFKLVEDTTWLRLLHAVPRSFQVNPSYERYHPIPTQWLVEAILRGDSPHVQFVPN